MKPATLFLNFFSITAGALCIVVVAPSIILILGAIQFGLVCTIAAALLFPRPTSAPPAIEGKY